MVMVSASVYQMAKKKWWCFSRVVACKIYGDGVEAMEGESSWVSSKQELFPRGFCFCSTSLLAVASVCAEKASRAPRAHVAAKREHKSSTTHRRSADRFLLSFFFFLVLQFDTLA